MFHDDHGDAGQQAQSGTQSSGGNPPQDDTQSQTGMQDDGSQGDDSQAADFRPRPPDSDLGIGVVGDFATTIAVPAHPNTNFDEVYFLKMLSGSISLTKNEKKKIVESVPKLSQYQIDELIKIFEEERRKFAELDEKHQIKIRELQTKQMEDWRDLEMEGKQQEQKGEDDAAAAALRAKLMGGNDQNKAA
jgi:hypothetical protein